LFTQVPRETVWKIVGGFFKMAGPLLEVAARRQVCPEDARENESSPRHGFRPLSSYPLRTGAKVWIVTERDGNTTTSTDVPGWLGWDHGGVKVTAPNP
jgi:hypothetical protein